MNISISEVMNEVERIEGSKPTYKDRRHIRKIKNAVRTYKIYREVADPKAHAKAKEATRIIANEYKQLRENKASKKAYERHISKVNGKNRVLARRGYAF